MWTFWIALLCFVAGGLALAWLIRRTNSLLGAEINIGTQLILYGALTVYLANRTAGYAARGNTVAAIVGGVLALVMFLVTALRAGALWVALTGRLDED